ncbi:MAG: ImmA/IrrE family metallo-endopeptidase [Chloroflexota bacterium]|nr:ImmA/IrrE family metallo-endopeptidase [Chloroflexota bacterium]
MSDPLELDAETAALRIRKEQDLTPRQPVGNIVDVLEHAGLKVFALPLGPDSPWAMYVPREGWHAVLLNAHLLEPQIRAAAAHELAHFAFQDGAHLDDASTMPLSDGSAPSGRPDKVERRAEAFARWFLVPRAALEKLKPASADGEVTPQQVFELAAEYTVPYRLVTMHLQVAGFISGNQRRGLDDRRGMNAASVLSRPASARAFPREYVENALRAYRKRVISFYKLAQLLRSEDTDIRGLRAFLLKQGELHEEDAEELVEETVQPDVTGRSS